MRTCCPYVSENAPMISSAEYPPSTSDMTSRCMDGDTWQLKSVVRQVYTSSVHPHWHLMVCSSASRASSLTTGRAPGLGARRTVRAASWSIATLLAADCCTSAPASCACRARGTRLPASAVPAAAAQLAPSAVRNRRRERT